MSLQTCHHSIEGDPMAPNKAASLLHMPSTRSLAKRQMHVQSCFVGKQRLLSDCGF